MKRILIPLGIAVFIQLWMINAPFIMLMREFYHLPKQTQKEITRRVVQKLICEQ